MNKTVAIWGNGNSGKTTLAVNLACALSKDHMVGVISAEDYGEVQTFFGQDIPGDRGTYNAFYGQHKDIKHTFQEMESVRNVFVLAPATNCNSISLSMLDEQTAYDIITNADHYFDVLLIDCTTNKNNALTGVAIAKASTILIPIAPIVSTGIWYASNKKVFDLIKNKTKYIKYAQNNDCDIESLCKSIDIDTSYEIPYEEKARLYQNEGKPIYENKIKHFNRKIDELAKDLIFSYEVNENEPK